MMETKLECTQRNIVKTVDSILIEKEINGSTEREAMGLPASVVDHYSNLFSTLYYQYRNKNVKALISLVEGAESHVFERICAANLLARIGDPRVGHLPNMVEIAGGEAVIGTKIEDIDTIFHEVEKYGVKRNWLEKEAPQYSCQLSSFSISKYPITNSQFRYFLLNSDYQGLPSSWRYGAYPLERSNHPTYTVTDQCAIAYCEWLTKTTNRAFRLPTEEEWEYVASGGKAKQYCWGNEFKQWSANTNEMLLQTTTPVGIFHESATATGIYDLIGNVEEYVSTNYKPHPGGEIVKDDLYLQLGNYRIAKGGAFNRFRDLARIQRRHGAYPSSLYAMGFRVAEEL